MQSVIINQRVLWQFQLAIDPDKNIENIEEIAIGIVHAMAWAGKPDRNHRAMRRWSFIEVGDTKGSASITYKGKLGSDEPLIITYFSFRGVGNNTTRRQPVVVRKNRQRA